MRKYVLLSLVCVGSSLLSVFIYTQFLAPEKVVRNPEAAKRWQLITQS